MKPPASAPEEIFLPSQKGARYLWLGLLIGLVIVLLSLIGAGRALTSPFLLVSLFLLGWFTFNRYNRYRQPYAVLNNFGIQSPHFSYGIKSLTWSNIAAVSLDDYRGAPTLEFSLKQAQSVGFSGGKHGTALLPLTIIDEARMDDLLQALNHRLGFVVVDNRPIVKPHAEEKLFSIDPEKKERLASAPEEIFLPSQKGVRYLWLGLLIGFVIVLLPVVVGKPLTSALPNLLFISIILIVLGWFIRSRYRRPYATLNDIGIQSPHFSHRVKSLAWSDIAAVSLATYGSAPALKFSLKQAQSVGSFGSKRDTAYLPLTLIDDAQKESFLQALDRRLDFVATDNRPMLKQYAEEKQFHEQLRQLSPQPWAVYSLIAINVAIWLLTVALGADAGRAPADKLLLWGGNAASEVQRGEWWRLLTATFLHSGLMHVAMNMLGLYAAGVMVERIYGARLFLLIYLGAGLAGSALSLSFAAQHAVSVGASGAVFGVVGALLVAVYQRRDKLPKTFSSQTLSSMGFFAVYALIQGFSQPGIDNAAHIGGLICGGMLAALLPERFDMDDFRRKSSSRGIAACGLVLIVVTALAALAPRATVDQGRILASMPILQKSMQELEVSMKALQQEAENVRSGKLSEREADDRSRTVFAPKFRQISSDLAQVVLPPGAPGEALLRDTKRFVDLMVETLAMESVYPENPDKPVPANPARAKEIQEEITALSARIVKESAALKQQTHSAAQQRSAKTDRR